MRPPRGAAPSVLVVEDRAHQALGHYPMRFGELAAGFAAAGCHVEALTARGWLGDHPWADFPVHRYGPVADVVERLGERCANTAAHSRRGRIRRRYGLWLRVAAMVGAARARRRRIPGPVVVVIVSERDAPALTAGLAGGGTWLAYVFRAPARQLLHARDQKALGCVAGIAERRRRARGGRCVFAAPAESVRAAWAACVPSLEFVTLPIAGTGVARSIENARPRLGYAESASLALFFGSDHRDKDLDTVVRAFGAISEWQLVVGGRLADHFTADEARGPSGFVDDDTRALLYAAADLVVLSFRAGFARNSGTLTDAITWGVPVVCSDRCAAADLVREYNLGAVFEPGDASSLAAAVRAVPRRIDPADLARARTELSNRAVAQRALDALGWPSIVSET